MHFTSDSRQKKLCKAQTAVDMVNRAFFHSYARLTNIKNARMSIHTKLLYLKD